MNVGIGMRTSQLGLAGVWKRPSTCCISAQLASGSVNSPAERSSTTSKRSLSVKSRSISAHAPLMVLCPDG